MAIICGGAIRCKVFAGCRREVAGEAGSAVHAVWGVKQHVDTFS